MKNTDYVLSLNLDFPELFTINIKGRVPDDIDTTRAPAFLVQSITKLLIHEQMNNESPFYNPKLSQCLFEYMLTIIDELENSPS